MRSVAQIDPQAGRPPAPAGRRPARAGRQRRRYRWISLLGGLLIVVMTYFPLVFVVSNSLKSGQSIFSSGVFSLFTQFDYQNYSTAWAGVSGPLANTIIVAAGSIVLGVTAAAAGAYAFSQLRFRGKELLFLAYIGLLLIPSTLTLIPLFLTIQKLHFFNTWWALILPYAATAQPLLVLIFRGFFDQIPRELLESARVDGCTEFQVLARIVAPLTRPVLLTGERMARLLDRPEPGPGERYPALRRWPGRSAGPCPDSGSLPAPGLYRGSAGDISPAVCDRARPVRGTAERPPGWRRVSHSWLDRLHPAHRLPDLRRDRAAKPGR